jgi:hypothetical protein
VGPEKKVVGPEKEVVGPEKKVVGPEKKSFQGFQAKCFRIVTFFLLRLSQMYV